MLAHTDLAARVGAYDRGHASLILVLLRRTMMKSGKSKDSKINYQLELALGDYPGT